MNTEEGRLAESLLRKNAMENRFQGLSDRFPFLLTVSALQPYLGDTRIARSVAS